MTQVRREDLLRNRMLRDLPPGDRDRLGLGLRKVRLLQGQVIYEPGDEVDHVYFPLSGLLAVVAPAITGQEVDCTVRGREGALGYVEACGTGVMSARLVSHVGGEALRVPAAAFRELYDESRALRELCARRIEFLLLETRQSLACHALHPAAGRLARLLLECVDRTGDRRFPLAQEFMAAMIGVGRTTVTHAAAELKRLGHIRYTRGRVQVFDRDGLQACACECYGFIRRARGQILGFECVDDGAGPPVERPRLARPQTLLSA